MAPLDRVKILFQASNPDFQKYSGKHRYCIRTDPQRLLMLFQVRGAAHFELAVKYTKRLEYWVCSKVIQSLYYECFRMQQSSLWHTTRFNMYPLYSWHVAVHLHVLQILMPTKEHETNFRRFSAGAMAGQTRFFCLCYSHCSGIQE